MRAYKIIRCQDGIKNNGTQNAKEKSFKIVSENDFYTMLLYSANLSLKCWDRIKSLVDMQAEDRAKTDVATSQGMLATIKN